MDIRFRDLIFKILSNFAQNRYPSNQVTKIIASKINGTPIRDGRFYEIDLKSLRMTLLYGVKVVRQQKCHVCDWLFLHSNHISLLKI